MYQIELEKEGRDDDREFMGNTIWTEHKVIMARHQAEVDLNIRTWERQILIQVVGDIKKRMHLKAKLSVWISRMQKYPLVKFTLRKDFYQSPKAMLKVESIVITNSTREEFTVFDGPMDDSKIVLDVVNKPHI